MAVHPDRARANNAAEDHEAAARVIASWQLVRLHYELRGELDDGDGQKEPEAFISVWVMRARETVESAWHVARTWFGEMENAPVHNSQLEKVERHKVYMKQQPYSFQCPFCWLLEHPCEQPCSYCVSQWYRRATHVRLSPHHCIVHLCSTRGNAHLSQCVDGAGELYVVVPLE